MSWDVCFKKSQDMGLRGLVDSEAEERSEHGAGNTRRVRARRRDGCTNDPCARAPQAFGRSSQLKPEAGRPGGKPPPCGASYKKGQASAPGPRVGCLAGALYLRVFGPRVCSPLR